MIEGYTNITKYFPLLPLFGWAFLIAFALTPIAGKIAKLIKAIDLPASQRKRDDKTLAQRLHKVAKPRLGGFAIIIAFLTISLTSTSHSPFLLSLTIGIIILTTIGILDDIFELPGKTQLLAQVVAAICVITGGTTISSIQVAGLSLNFDLWSTSINFFGYVYNFVFPADLITIGWILTLVNALNWVGGIDALEESVSFIAAVTLMFLGVKTGNMEVALLSMALAGSIAGFIPFNFPPSKILSGTAGDTVLGFTIATLAITGGGKISAAVLILIIPLIDMAWVLIGRIRKNHLKNPLELLAISDRTHLHHRLLDLGFNDKAVLFIESTAIAVLSTLSFYLSDLSRLVIIGVSASLILFTFSIINVAIKVRQEKLKKEEKEKEDLPPDPPPDEPTPESKYAY
ncbi:undecaprenyl/decaprenyl-phosphate alpha-N-acetylglucosaminyl 1-phosphate transferase [Candidatus Dojkabacteria bacterium]|nr:undecaprenyl/decaprenyl-phosphate alpha-N-acetylglucosaminyl 1-phosphate transferase [Candidatus Dojkabacteria bacterium]